MKRGLNFCRRRREREKRKSSQVASIRVVRFDEIENLTSQRHFSHESVVRVAGLSACVLVKLSMRPLSLQRKRQVAATVSVAAEVIFSMSEAALIDDEHRIKLASARKAYEELKAMLDGPLKGGRGRSLLPRLPTLKFPKNRIYAIYIEIPDRFKEECGWSPTEFHDLLNDVRDVLVLARNHSMDYTDAENRRRRRRAFKYRPEERLFAFLVYLRRYPALRSFSIYYGLGYTALWADIKWLRAKLVTHEALKSEIAWPSAQERSSQRQLLVDAGLLPPAWSSAVAIFDGTKDPAEKPRDHEKELADYNGNKGFGKTHMLGTDLFGKPIYLEAGLCGNHNDRGLWVQTSIYREPESYLSADENALMDGVFQGELHSRTTRGALIPASKAAIASGRTFDERQALRGANRQQRRLRVVIEQTIGIISQYDIIGRGKYRGSVETQGLNFLLCTQLTARTMRLRNSYPRGRHWLTSGGELEQWEREMGDYLYVDPSAPDLY